MSGSSAATARRRAYAKVNLALSVGPAIPSRGLHPIVSWMAPVDLADDLTVSRLGEGSPSRYTVRWAADAPRRGPGGTRAVEWPIDQDLAVRAHRLLERRAGRALPVEVTLEKRIPAGGGLGGGSSDAAAMLMAVNGLFRLGLSASDLAALSAPLGSDVAYFIDEQCMGAEGGEDGGPPRAAIVSGVGDHLERIHSPSQEPILLLVPPVSCPTGPVYAAYDRMAAGRALQEKRVRRLAGRARELGAVGPLSRELFNDLAEAACQVQPRLGALRESLERALGEVVHITGSGSTMFVLPAHDEPAHDPRGLSPPPWGAEDVVGVATRLL